MTRTIVLAGGLGNQLFQLSAAIENWSDGFNVLPISRSTLSKEMEYLLSNKNIKIANDKISWLRLKYIGLCFRSSRIKLKVFRRTLTFTLYLIALILFREKYGIGCGIESDSAAKRLVRNNGVLVGYFQSDVHLKNRAILSEISRMLNLVDETSAKETQKPYAVIQIRRGDYSNEKSIGMLSKEYFEEAIKMILRDFPGLEIYIVTNDITSVRKEISIDLLDQCNYANPELSDLETVKFMSKSVVIFISNSTFGWWGAKLGPEKEVYAPFPWFKKLPFEDQIYPIGWNVREAKFT